MPPHPRGYPPNLKNNDQQEVDFDFGAARYGNDAPYDCSKSAGLTPAPAVQRSATRGDKPGARGLRIRYHLPMRIVETTADLKALADELKGAPYIALDTEFMRDSTYWPILCLVQIAAPGVAAIVDPLADGIDLAPFFALLKNP